MNNESRIKAALSYAELGWSVIPLYEVHQVDGEWQCSCRKGAGCGSPGKHPRTKNGCKDGTTDKNQIENWWGKYPEANIGIVTGEMSDLIVLDVDIRPGGEESLRLIKRDLADLSDPAVVTGGGFHYYFKFPRSAKITSATPLPGIDLKGGRGYVVAPPSNHISGVTYGWLRTLDTPLDDFPFQIEELLSYGNNVRSGEESFREGTVISKGNRHNALLDKAVNIHHAGKTPKQIESELTTLNENVFDPPFDSEELKNEIDGIITWVSQLKRKQLDADLFGTYLISDGGMYFRKETQNGSQDVKLSNFIARIVSETTFDNGVEQFKHYTVEITQGGVKSKIEIEASKFDSMSWLSSTMGVSAIIEAGNGIKDKLRAAIQYHSLQTGFKKKNIYSHLGWRKIDGDFYYLHSGGGIGAGGNGAQIEVRLAPSLKNYSLPVPPKGSELKDAVSASLDFLEVGDLSITLPLFASIYRSVIARSSFSVHVSGKTGVYKTALVALCQQHFGSEMTSTNLPGAWSGTGNSLEALSFYAKDSLMVIDDFVLAGSTYDMQKQHKEADRLLRAQGNNSGRSRMRQDTSLRESKPPRGTILSTGEDIPKGHSLRARIFIIELEPGTINLDKLTILQNNAGSGMFAKCLSGYVYWLAKTHPNKIEKIDDDIQSMRQEAYEEGMHRRVPDIVANLALGLKYFLDYAIDSKAIRISEKEKIWAEWWATLCKAGQHQDEHHRANNPALRFLELLSTAISSGKAHIASLDGEHPLKNPEAWGWREKVIGTGEYQRCEWQERGERIGWVHRENLFLDPDASLSVVQKVGREIGDQLSITPKTLNKRLKEERLLKAVDFTRETLTVRKTLEGRQRNVLCLDINSLSPLEEDKSPEVKSEKVSVLELPRKRYPHRPTSDLDKNTGR
jgi:Bifunctional DNA primase/polymerase, N-terminal